jgi:hypothetical protein
MANERLYRRTEAGTTAVQQQDAGVPLAYRRLLSLVEGDTHPDTLRARVPSLSPAAAARMLDELVARGLLEAIAVQAHHDLDFTGSFTLARPRAAQRPVTRQ